MQIASKLYRPTEKGKFYKYMNKKYVGNFLKGVLRIGTLYGFRAIEDSEIGDKGEGTMQYLNKVDYYHSPFDGDVNIPGIVRGEFMFDTIVANSSFSQEIHWPDAYVFCVTDEPPSAEFMKKIGYDACVEISDLFAFTDLLFSRLGAIGFRGNVFAVNPCIYNGRQSNDIEVKRRGILHPQSGYYHKEPRYSYQKEFRIVISAKKNGESISPVTILCGDIAKLCREVTL